MTPSRRTRRCCIEIEQAPGRRHDEVRAGAERDLLALLADAPVDDRVAESQMAPVGRDAIGDLRGELARRRQDERADARATARTPPTSLWRIGRTNAAVLPGPGLGAGEDVAALEGARNDLDLHGRGLRVLLVEDRANERSREAQRRERRGGDRLLDLGRHRRGARLFDARRVRKTLRGLRAGVAAAACGA